TAKSSKSKRCAAESGIPKIFGAVLSHLRNDHMRTLTPPYMQSIRSAAHSLTGAPHDYDALLDRIGDARFVLIGEASHGTHEFYQQRAEITKRLIEEKQFTAVAVEADWPDAYRINRFVRGYP